MTDLLFNTLQRDKAISQIAAGLSETNRHGATFLIGAGCSKSADIPLAGELIAEARRRFEDHLCDLAVADAGDYGKVMGCLDQTQRRALILPHIARAKLNWGHIALAHLMAEEHVTRVLSLNFDPLLARANGLLGKYPAIYDFGSAPASNVKAMAEPCIVHLHGQSTGFVLLNTEEETYKHVSKLQAVITDSIQERMLVVIGYSGGSDGAMAALKKAYDDTTRLYWIGFSESPSAHIAEFLSGKRYAHYVGGGDSCRFLLDVVRAVAAKKKASNWTPKVFHDPIGHLIDEVTPVIDFPVTNKDDDDILVAWRSQMAELKGEHDKRFGKSRAVEQMQIQGDDAGLVKATPTGQTFVGENAAAKAARRAAYWAAIKLGNERRNIALTLNGVARKKQFSSAIASYAKAVALETQPHEALNNWGLTLADMARDVSGDEQDRLFHQAITKHAAALMIQPDKYGALNNWGSALFELGKRANGAEKQQFFEQAVAKYEAAQAIKFGSDAALSNWGLVLVEMAKLASGAEQSRLFEESIVKCNAALELKPEDHVNLYNLGNVLFEKAKRTGGPEQVRLFRAATAKYEAALSIKFDFHHAYNNWGVTLASMAGRSSGAEQQRLYEEASEKYAAVLELKSDNHEALNNWSVTLVELGRRASDEDKNRLFMLARQKSELCEHLMPGWASYNLACLAGLTGDPVSCRDSLMTSHKKGRLPNRKHLDADTDLDSVRGLPWFEEIRQLAKAD